jgi:hypothetical protein
MLRRAAERSTAQRRVVERKFERSEGRAVTSGFSDVMNKHRIYVKLVSG